MIKKIVHITTILFLILSCGYTYAQDNRTMDVKVTDILAQMPTQDLVHRDHLMEELADLGTEGFEKMIQRLTPPGVRDDTAVRFALNSLARYASEFGKEEIREFIERELLAALNKQSDTEVRTFLLNQLNLIAGDKSVDQIKTYLSDQDLTEPAAQCLLSIGTPAAARALFEALPNAADQSVITIIKALGELQYGYATRAITTFAETGSLPLRKTALSALASVGDPGSYKFLLNAAKEVNFDYDPSNAAEAVLNYADRLGEREETDLCKKLLKTIIKSNKSAGKLHNYSKALSIYAKYYGYNTMPMLLEAVDIDDKPFRYSVLNIAENIGGVAGTREWTDKAEAASPELKAEIIDMLGRRGDRQAVGFITQNLSSPSGIVRQEVIEALVKLEGRDAVPVLTDHLSAGNDIPASKNALMQLLDKKHLNPVAEAMVKSSGAVRAAFIDIIAAKSGNSYFNQILGYTGSEDPDEKSSAFRALRSVATEDNLNQLITLLLSTESESEIDHVSSAIVEAAKGVDSEKREGGRLLQALKNTGKKERIIAILPETGGEVALKTVTDYFNNSSGTVKEAAFKALTNWKDYSASTALYEISRQNSGNYREKAFASFVRQVQTAGLPDDQKLLQYRKIMPYAENTKDKNLVINSIGNLKTFLSLIFLEKFLDDREVQQSAARAIMKIAMPDDEGLNGFSGRIVRNMLKRVASVITGEESEYDKININNYLEKMPEDEGYVSMFNGNNLDGWQGLVGNPVTRAQMSKEELAAKQIEANQKMLENWSVKDNTIAFTGRGANLCSVKEYGDFELITDWRITKNGDSGIYLRGTPQVQIWDTSRVDVGAQVGSGGLYNNKKYESKPLKVADNPVGEWNTFHITMIGENVTIYLNGELVVDNIPLENYWDRSQPIFEKGTIELQAHGTDLAFRDIYVREIKTNEIGLSREEIEEGFVSLFNGKNLDGWQGNKTDYIAENGELLVRPSRGGHGNLYTGKEYSDFIFRFEFQLTPAANNGLGIRTPLSGDAAYQGIELQILDNTAPVYATLKEYQYHGSVYGVIPAKRGFLRPVGEWNEQEVVVKGSRITVTLNGTVILDGDIKEASRNGTMDGRDHPGLKKDKGYIGFLGHGSELKFRKIRIKDLGNS